jgi:hypothetical protein
VSFSPPYTGTFNIAAPDHVLPRSYQSNVTLDQRLGANQTLSASYVGELGRKLLRENQLIDPNARFSDSVINLTTNSSASDYHALEVQFQRRLAGGLAALASYTWSHSTDDTSDEEGLDNFTNPRIDHGASDFDIRHSFSLAFTYAVPQLRGSREVRSVLGNWSVAGILSARTALPLSVYVLRDDTNGDPSLNVDAGKVRPDVVPGVPLYIHDASAAGGTRLNPAAFDVPVEVRQGDLARNSLRGSPLTNLDFALWRQFRLTESFRCHVRVDAFNLLNHPSFGGPDPVLGEYAPPLAPNPTFGAVSSTYNGARSVQLSMRLQF